jgi:hypothetical protein
VPETVLLGAGNWYRTCRRRCGKKVFDAYNTYPEALEVAGLGYSEVCAEGKVYNLQKVSNFTGVYVAAEASATAGRDGPGVLSMRNQHGVVIHLSSQQAGLKLTLGGEGMRVVLK